MENFSYNSNTFTPITAHNSAPSHDDSIASCLSNQLPSIGIVADDVSSLLDKFEEVEVVSAETSEICGSTTGFSCSVNTVLSISSDDNTTQNDSTLVESCKTVCNNVINDECNVPKAHCDDRFRNVLNVQGLSSLYRPTWNRNCLNFSNRPTAKARGGKIKTIESSCDQLFNKLPNYCTALSIPARAVAGSTAQSTSDLVAEFIQHQSKEDECVPVLDKIPAYQSSFTNSFQYDLDNVVLQEQIDKYTIANFDQKTVQPENSASMLYDNCFSSEDFTKKSLDKAKHNKRLVVYIGRIPKSLSSMELRILFEQFGDIHTCSVHIREHGDSYGFVTYVHPDSAARAVDGANAIAGCESLDVCFGGRRQFCMSDYADLDGKTVVREEFTPFSRVSSESRAEVDFDDLLFMARQERRSDDKI